MSATTQNPFRAARRAGVPICAIETADPAATVRACCLDLVETQKRLKKDKTDPVMLWDIVQGLRGLNEPGTAAAKKIAGENPSNNPSEMLDFTRVRCPDDAVLFMNNADAFLNNPDIVSQVSFSQAVWNLRDPFAAQHCTLVLLAPAITLPASLKHDCVVFTEPLPGETELAGIVKSVAEDSARESIIKQAEADKPYIVDTLRGLSAFAAQQVLAMSVNGSGIDKDGLWTRKAKMIEQTPGLAVWKGNETFDDLGGLVNLKRFLTCILSSQKTAVRAIGFIDEIEKAMGGTTGDTSGTSQDALQTVLKFMQDENTPGLILIGPGGTGKSAVAKAAGKVASAPVISIDLGAMKDSLVGSSEKRVRMAFEVFKAVSQGKGLFIATCNRITSLPPELRRRFTLGTFFVDLPGREEQRAIWDIWRKRYALEDNALPDCDGWTGAEIRGCCDTAYRTGMTLKEAAGYIVPVCKSAPDQVDGLRRMADGKFISANEPGLYKYSDPSRSTAPVTGRKMEL